MKPGSSDRILQGVGVALAILGLLSISLAGLGSRSLFPTLLGVVGVVVGFVLFTTATGHRQRNREAPKDAAQPPKAPPTPP